jgi:hypothetical protein
MVCPTKFIAGDYNWGDDGKETMWLAETKDEMRTNVPLKNGSAELWCEKMSTTRYGRWHYLFAPQLKLEKALSKGTSAFANLAADLLGSASGIE